jgi:hypothetical protein
VVPVVNGNHRRDVQTDTDNEVYTKGETLVFDHRIADYGTENGPRQCHKVERSLRVSSVFIGNQLGNGSESGEVS